MLFFSSRHRCGDQFVQQNSLERAPEPHRASPTPPQIHCHSPIAETAYTISATLQQSPNSLNNFKQEECTQSLSPPLPYRQSLHNWHSFPIPHEPSHTDPGFIEALWSEVMAYNMGAHNLPESQQGINLMRPSTAEEADSPGFSSAAFPEVLQRHQVTIKEDVEASFWLRVCEAVGGASAEEGIEIEGCKVWEDNDEDAEAKAMAKAEADAQDLAARMTVVVASRDLGQTDRQLFFTEQILHNCPLPGVRAFNNLMMLDVATEPYHLIPVPYHPIYAGESSISSIPSLSIAIKSTKPTVSTTRPFSAPPRCYASQIPVQNAAQTAVQKPVPKPVQKPVQTAVQKAVQPAKIHPTTLRGLDLPRDLVDCAYWLEASGLHSLDATSIARQTFVSEGLIRKTSLYLSIASGDSEYGSFTEKRLWVKHKIAVYGATALYNRHLLHDKALKSAKSFGYSDTQLERGVCILHFGLALMGAEATLYVFRCEEENPGKTDQATAWQGCNMSKVGEWTLTAAKELADMLYHIHIVADWVKRVYVPVLHDDLTQLSNNFRH